jgi:predicted nucleotidyltransferase
VASLDTTSSTLNLIRRLNDQGIEFVVIGGIAAIVHGSARVTYDLDVCAPVDHGTCVKVVTAVSDLHPRFRSRPDLPVVTPDNSNLRDLKNLYLRTDEIMLDVLGEVAGVGTFADCLRESEMLDFHGIQCRVLKLEALLRAKKAAGRDKDLMAIPELEALLRLQSAASQQPPPQER